MFAAVWTGPECFAGGGLERAVCAECCTVVPPCGWRLSHLCYVKALLLLSVVLPTVPIALTLSSSLHPGMWSSQKLTDRYTQTRKLIDRNTRFRNWLKESDRRRVNILSQLTSRFDFTSRRTELIHWATTLTLLWWSAPINITMQYYLNILHTTQIIKTNRIMKHLMIRLAQV